MPQFPMRYRGDISTDVQIVFKGYEATWRQSFEARLSLPHEVPTYHGDHLRIQQTSQDVPANGT